MLFFQHHEDRAMEAGVGGTESVAGDRDAGGDLGGVYERPADGDLPTGDGGFEDAAQRAGAGRWGGAD